jgi:hypothetical protein
MATDKLLVCSVFAGSELDGFWLELQRQQLSATVGEFDHAVYLSHRADQTLFKQSVTVGTSSPGDKWEHRDGVRALTDYCHQHPAYSGYLLLDSDAFPIVSDWKGTLDYCLKRFNKSYAAAIRVENLDTFPHPCVAYARDPHSIRFIYRTTLTLLGQSVTDLSGSAYDFFPLLKTNRKSLHPIIATIYFDLFYHHGAGSRSFSSRAINAGYYDQILTRSCNTSDELYELLRKDPQGFIASLCGAKESVSDKVDP